MKLIFFMPPIEPLFQYRVSQASFSSKFATMRSHSLSWIAAVDYTPPTLRRCKFPTPTMSLTSTQNYLSTTFASRTPIPSFSSKFPTQI